MHTREFRQTMKTFKQHLEEGGLKLVDIWKTTGGRENKKLFIKMALAGELVDNDGEIIDAEPKKVKALVKIIRTLDEVPDSKKEKYKELSRAVKDAYKALSKISKDGNGFSPPSSGEPKGEDWESLIAVAVNKINKVKKWKSGSEWKRAEKFWSNYQKLSIKLGHAFIAEFSLTDLKQLGDATLPTNTKWKGRNKTPKTDLLHGTHKISLKKHGGSQLMSAGPDEAVSTFEAAMARYSISTEGKKKVATVMNSVQKNMGAMSTKGTIGAIEKLRDANPKSRRPAAVNARIKEMEGLQVNAELLTKKLDKLFKDKQFKKYFCWEAASGEVKFKPSPKGISNVIVTFKDTGSIANILPLDSPAKAGKILANGNGFYVSFKTGGGGSKPYLSLRSSKLSAIKKLLNQGDDIPTFKTIIMEEYKREFINESVEHLDEFKLFDKLKRKIKDVSKDVVDSDKKILSTVMKRISEAFDYILKLGEQMLQGFLIFFGLSISNVAVEGGGKYPLL